MTEAVYASVHAVWVLPKPLKKKNLVESAPWAMGSPQDMPGVSSQKVAGVGSQQEEGSPGAFVVETMEMLKHQDASIEGISDEVCRLQWRISGDDMKALKHLLTGQIEFYTAKYPVEQ